MTKQTEERQTAKIYVFPTRPRMAAAGAHHAYAERQMETHPPVVTYGGAWYHDAAIEEVEEAGDFPRRHH